MIDKNSLPESQLDISQVYNVDEFDIQSKSELIEPESIEFGEDVESDDDSNFVENHQASITIPGIEDIFPTQLPPRTPLVLSEVLNTVLGANERAERPDYSKYRDSAKENWQELVDGDNVPEHVISILKQCLLVPKADFQIPIIASYLMLPSALCNMLPILYSHGLTGSGKSTVGNIACAIHKAKPIAAGSTFAFIRNAVNSARWYDVSLGEVVGNERNGILVWEDISREELIKQDRTILAILKVGIERDGTMGVAAQGGQNNVFKVFLPKYISSIHPLYSDYDFRELIRRLIIVQHKPYRLWKEDDFSNFYKDTEPQDLIKVDDINWEGFNNEYNKYWTKPDVLNTWSVTSKSLKRRKNHGIPDVFYKISRDLITCGLVCEYWADYDEAFAHMREYWDWHMSNIESQVSATQKVLQQFINERTSLIKQRNQEMIEQGNSWAIQPLEVNPKELKAHLIQASANGELDTGISPKEITNAMANLGWQLDSNKRGGSTWIPIRS